ncbi:MAG: CocE/NonD family hydrolase [Pseudomonadota bacterium]
MPAKSPLGLLGCALLLACPGGTGSAGVDAARLADAWVADAAILDGGSADQAAGADARAGDGRVDDGGGGVDVGALDALTVGDAGASLDANVSPDAGVSADAATLDAASPPPPCGSARVREELAIPTVDGYTLSAFLDRPAQANCRLPTILLQTPYNKESFWNGLQAERTERPLFNSPHYNIVAVDWRGRFGSSSLPHPGDGAWMAQDSYDTVEWIAVQSWSDGKVGTWGVSALCGAQYRTAAGPQNNAQHPDFDDTPPPHLVAMVPIMCPIRTSYDQAYPGGVLRHEWMSALDVLGFGLRTTYENNPRKNWLWSLLDAAIPSDRIAVPALVVGGWWDVNSADTLEAFAELRLNSAPAVRDQHRLLMGPWIHFATGGAVGEGAARPLTQDEWVFMDVDRVIDRDSLAFFDLHLRGVSSPAEHWARVRYHHENAGWQSADQWPPTGVTTRSLYLDDQAALVASAPASGAMSFPYSPADPSPTLGGPTLAPYNCVASATPLLCTLAAAPDTILLHGPMSQAALYQRGDQRTFVTAPLSEPLALLGALRVHLDVATTGLDTDFAVRVLDIAEDQDPWLIGDGMQRLSARDGNTAYSTVTPGQRYSLTVRISKDFAYSIPAGHRLGLMISSSNWPLAARNPNDGAVFLASDVTADTNEEFSYGLPATIVDLKGSGVDVTNTLYLDGASRVEFEVAPGS